MAPDFPVDITIADDANRVFISMTARREDVALFSRLRRGVENWVSQLEFDVYGCACSLYTNHNKIVVDVKCENSGSVKLATTYLLNHLRAHAKEEAQAAEDPAALGTLACS